MLTLIDQLYYTKFQKRMQSEIIAVLNGTDSNGNYTNI